MKRFVLCLGFFPFCLFAQESGSTSLYYARSIIDTLASESFSGRGYVEEGMEKSAAFIAREFEKLGLEKLNGSYFQEFTMPINVIYDAELNLNGKPLQYGIDFLVKPNSKSQDYQQKGMYHFDPKDFANSLASETRLIDFIQLDMIAQKGKHVVFPPYHFEIDSLNQYYKHWANFYSTEENRNRSVFYFTGDKLTASLSQTQDSITTFIIDEKYYTKDLNIDNYKVETEFIKEYPVKNIMGRIEGRDPDSLIVITAHYDHLGKVGNAYFPGASDNASGVAFMLGLAKHFTRNKPAYTLIFIAFGAEEAGLIGSRYFVQNPLIDLKKIKFLLNFDIMGAGEDGIQIVNSSVFTKEYELLNQINSERKYVKQIKKRGEACNSDHCPFYEKGVPSFFTYTLGGPGHYHDVFDTGDSLNLAEFEDLQKLFIAFTGQL